MDKEKKSFKERAALNCAWYSGIGAFLVLAFDDLMQGISKLIVGALLFSLMYLLSLNGNDSSKRSF